jgi:hypothetical protein
MRKFFIFLAFVIPALPGVFFTGCSGAPENAGEGSGSGLPCEPERFLMCGIALFPGSESVLYSGGLSVLGEGVEADAFMAPAGLVEVYRFYTEHLKAAGFKLSGNIFLGDASYFILEVSLDGADFAIIRASGLEGETKVVIWHSIEG